MKMDGNYGITRTMVPTAQVVARHAIPVLLWQVYSNMPKKNEVSCVATKKKRQAIGYGTYLPFRLALRQKTLTTRTKHNELPTRRDWKLEILFILLSTDRAIAT